MPVTSARPRRIERRAGQTPLAEVEFDGTARRMEYCRAGDLVLPPVGATAASASEFYETNPLRQANCERPFTSSSGRNRAHCVPEDLPDSHFPPAEPSGERRGDANE